MALTLLAFTSCRWNSDDAKFIRKNETVIGRDIIKELDPTGKHLKNVNLKSITAKGGYFGMGTYSISVRAYANDNPKYSMRVELVFPGSQISPFTLIKPNPHRDEEMDLSFWEMRVYYDENEHWNWKMEEEQAAIDAEEKALKEEEQRKQELSDQIRPHLHAWLEQHQSSIETELEELLYSRHPELRTVLGKIETLSLYDVWYYYNNGDYIMLEIHFEQFPNDVAKVRGRLILDDFSFQDLSKGGTLSFSSSGISNFELQAEYDTPIDKAIRKVHGGEFIIRDIEEIRID